VITTSRTTRTITPEQYREELAALASRPVQVFAARTEPLPYADSAAAQLAAAKPPVTTWEMDADAVANLAALDAQRKQRPVKPAVPVTEKRLPLHLIPTAELRKAWSEGRTYRPQSLYRRQRPDPPAVENMTWAQIDATARTGALASESRRCWQATGAGAASLDQSNGEDSDGDPIAFADLVTEANCAPHRWTPYETVNPRTADLIEFEHYASECGPTATARPVANATGRIAIAFDRWSSSPRRLALAKRLRSILADDLGEDALSDTFANLQARLDLVREAMDSQPDPYPHNIDEARDLTTTAARHAAQMDDRPRPILTDEQAGLLHDARHLGTGVRRGYPGPNEDEFAPRYAHR